MNEIKSLQNRVEEMREVIKLMQDEIDRRDEKIKAAYEILDITKYE